MKGSISRMSVFLLEQLGGSVWWQDWGSVIKEIIRYERTILAKFKSGVSIFNNPIHTFDHGVNDQSYNSMIIEISEPSTYPFNMFVKINGKGFL